MLYDTFLKKLLLHLPGARAMASRYTRHIPRVLMYHRFMNQGLIKGVSGAVFKWHLKVIRDHFQVLSLGQYADMVKCGTCPNDVAIITVDDAYLNFYTVAYPLLREYEMQATLFVATDFIDKRQWFWWDKIKYIMEKTTRETADIQNLGHNLTVSTKPPRARYAGWSTLCDYCLPLPAEARETFIRSVATSLGVNIPPLPVDNFRQMTWEQVREVSRNNVEVGTHTISHTILTSLDKERWPYEIEGSKSCLEQEIGRPVKSFCYPNGMPSDYSNETAVAVRKAGYTAAVVAHEGPYDRADLYTIKRMGIASNDRASFLWKVSGFSMIRIL